MFTKEGTVQLIIGEVKFAECRFPDGKGPNDFDICVEVTDAADAVQHDWARLEWSENYGKGNMATMKQREITMRTLRGIGFEGDDLSTLPGQIAGKTVPGFVKASKPNADGKSYMNVYLGSGGGNAPKADDVLSPEELKRRLTGAAGASGSSAGSASKPAAASTTAPRNPFARTTEAPRF